MFCNKVKWFTRWLCWRNRVKKVYVVLPAYNEAMNLGSLLERIDEAMTDDGTLYEIVLVDETLAVGDALFQEKCLAKIAEFQREGRTIVVVSHDMEAVKKVATRAVWLAHARVAADSHDIADVVAQYLASLRGHGT